MNVSLSIIYKKTIFEMIGHFKSHQKLTENFILKFFLDLLNAYFSECIFLRG